MGSENMRSFVCRLATLTLGLAVIIHSKDVFMMIRFLGEKSKII